MSHVEGRCEQRFNSKHGVWAICDKPKGHKNPDHAGHPEERTDEAPTMAQHTPGPWYVNETEHTYGRLVVRGKSGERVACIMGETHINIERDDSANARLIAKAPEMYDAASELLNALPPLTDAAAKAAHKLNDLLKEIER